MKRIAQPPLLVIRFVALAAVLFVVLSTLLAAEAVAAANPRATSATPGIGAAQTLQSAQDTQPASVLILLDTSGSMADKDSRGRVKIDAAKEAISGQVEATPARTRLGLMTYPTSSSSAPCSSAQLRVPVKGVDPAEFASALGSLPKPVGGTPTSEALKEAADYLQGQGVAQMTIVLVSDGEANCGPASCDTAKDLVAKGIRITVNPVGFDISGAGRGELECIASATGGKYVDAKDGTELQKVIGNQINPGLDVTVQYPLAPVALTEAAFPVTVGIRVGALVGRNVKASLRQTDAAEAGMIRRPAVALGNIDPGHGAKVDWSIQPPSNRSVKTNTFKVVVTADGAPPVTRQFQVSYIAIEGSLVLGPALGAFHHVLVMGDSYSSGEGSGTTDRPYFAVNDQAQDCDRSKNQYAGWLYSPADVTIVACAGAVNQNIVHDGQYGEPSQIDQLRTLLGKGYRPDVIFISVGGNDIGFPNVVQSCVLYPIRSIIEGTLSHPLDPCMARQDSALYPDLQTLLGFVPNENARTFTKLASLFTENKLTTPPIVVVPYPKLFANEEKRPIQCDLVHNQVEGQALAPAFNAFASVQNLLNQAAQEAVDRASRAGVPVYFASDVEDAVPPKHSVCSSDPWFVTVTIAGYVSNEKELFHPNVLGYQAMALAISRWGNAQPSLPGADYDKPTSDSWQAALFSWNPVVPQIKVDAASKGLLYTSDGSIEIIVDKAQPQSPVTFYIESQPVALGSVYADAKGHATLTIDLQPWNVPPGTHTITAIFADTSGQTQHRKATIEIQQPFPLALWAALGLGLLLAVTGLILLRRWKTARVADRTGGEGALPG